MGESAIFHDQHFSDTRNVTGITWDWTEVIAISVVEAAIKCNADCIIVLTRSGRSAMRIAKYRPRCPILAVTRFEQASRQCYLHRGFIKNNRIAVVVSGWAQGRSNTTNTMRLV